MKIYLPLFFLYFLATSASAELVPQLSSQLNDYNFNLSSRYNIAVFARSEQNFEGAKIWQVKITEDNNFETPEELSLGPEQYRYSDPMLSADGQTLFFISDMPLSPTDKSNDYNIWQASWLDGQWQNIRPLPSAINSDEDELGPELHNGVLYFASARDGKLSLYQADTTKKSIVVTPHTPLQHESLQQSDLTFSPDGNIAVFWQLSQDRKDTVLMMQRRSSKGWGQPQIMPEQVQSNAHEFTPQFSPDGQWIYISSSRHVDGYAQLNIHRFATKEIFPQTWYRNHLAKVELSILAGKERMASIHSFEYDLAIKQGGIQNKEHVKIEFGPFQLWKTRGDQLTWTDGNNGYRKASSGESRALTEPEIKRLVQSVRYNFIYMFKQDKTKLFAQYSTKGEQRRLYRVHAQGLRPFSILLSPFGNTIEQLRYDDQAVGLEQQYKNIDGVLWPMNFEYIVGQKILVKGVFSNVKINEPE